MSPWFLKRTPLMIEAFRGVFLYVLFYLLFAAHLSFIHIQYLIYRRVCVCVGVLTFAT